jgi:uncharacterized membrane-anchored protein YitT (DUF2179 family)
MKNIIGLVLILIGGALIYQGVSRKDSLAGAAAQVGTDVANAVDGKSRVPQHLVYMIGGGVLAAVGLGVLFRGGKSA